MSVTANPLTVKLNGCCCDVLPLHVPDTLKVAMALDGETVLPPEQPETRSAATAQAGSRSNSTSNDKRNNGGSHSLSISSVGFREVSQE